MYLYHFGLKELPFTLTPNTSYYYGLPCHREAIEVISHALKAGEGFIKVTGEVGTGKTLICRKILNELPEHFVTAYIPNPYLSPEELRRAVAAELDVDLSTQTDQQEFTQRIQQKLIEIHKGGNSVVLIIDEAQALPTDSLEVLRLFTNLETESRKLLQVVLFGQPEQDQKISKGELRQLRQRITFSYSLKTMTKDQLYFYLKHRLQVAGHGAQEIFSRKVCDMMHKASRGTPRIVNVLAHKALMLAYGQGKEVVTKEHARLAIRDTDACVQSSRSKQIVLVTFVVALLLLSFLSFKFLTGVNP